MSDWKDRLAARAKAGPYIESPSQVGNGSLQVVVIPHPWGGIEKGMLFRGILPDHYQVRQKR